MQHNDRRPWASAVAILLLLCLLGGWAMAFFGTPTDSFMGPVYRIIYLHVPSAFGAFMSSFILMAAGVVALRKRSEAAMLFGRATAEVGLIFTALTLATGSIWGYPTWGTYWTWDARLTTTLILAILYIGYLMLYASLPRGPSRIKACAVCAILIFADVPIIYKSVTWWRTLHQPPSIMREGGSTMDPEMLRVLIFCGVITLLMAVWLMVERYWNLKMKLNLEDLSEQVSARTSLGAP